MWMITLLLALAHADEDAYATCCRQSGGIDCPTQLTVLGPGSVAAFGRTATEIAGTWALSCTDGTGFFPAATRLTTGRVYEGDVLTELSDEAAACFQARCELPSSLCLGQRGDQLTVVRCDSGRPPAGEHWRDARLLQHPSPFLTTRGAVRSAPQSAPPREDDVEDSWDRRTAEDDVEDSWDRRTAEDSWDRRAAGDDDALTVSSDDDEPWEPAASSEGDDRDPWERDAPPVASAVSERPADGSSGRDPWERADAPTAAPPAPAAPSAPPPLRASSPVALTAQDLVTPRTPPQPCIPNPSLRQPSIEQVDQGDEALLSSDHARALGHYRAAITIDACNAFAWAALGHTLLEAGSPRASLESLQTVTRLMPAHFRAWTDLGRAQEALGQLSQARVSYQRALEIRAGYRPAEEGLQRASR